MDKKKTVNNYLMDKKGMPRQVDDNEIEVVSTPDENDIEVVSTPQEGKPWYSVSKEGLWKGFKNSLPAAGAMIGAAVSTPETLGAGTLPGAAMGGAIGKGAQQLIEGVEQQGMGYFKPKSPSLTDMAKATGEQLEGAKQGLEQEMGGQIATKAIGMAGQGLKAAGKKVTEKILDLPYKVFKGDPQAMDAVMESGVVGPFSSKPRIAENANAKVGEYEKELQDIIARTPDKPMSSVDDIAAKYDKPQNQVEFEPERALREETGKKFENIGVSKLTPEELLRGKRVHADTAYGNEKMLQSGEADAAASRELGDKLKQAVPETGDVLARQQKMIQLRNYLAGKKGGPFSSVDLKRPATYLNPLMQAASGPAYKIGKLLEKNAFALGQYSKTLAAAKQRGEGSYKATVHVLLQDPQFRETLTQAIPDQDLSDEEPQEPGEYPQD